MKDDQYYLSQAYLEALKALNHDEVPIGCVIVKDDKIISRGFNKKEETFLVTSHAEINALNKACKKLKTYHLEECVCYVTLEPCLMCASALIQAKIKRIVYGAISPKNGACGSFFDVTTLSNLNHYPLITYISDEKCKSIISNYFKNKRLTKEKED